MTRHLHSVPVPSPSEEIFGLTDDAMAATAEMINVAAARMAAAACGNARFMMRRVDEIEPVIGRYFELSVDELNQLSGRMPNLSLVGDELLRSLDAAGWGLYIELSDDGICRVSPTATAQRQTA